MRERKEGGFEKEVARRERGRRRRGQRGSQMDGRKTEKLKEIKKIKKTLFFCYLGECRESNAWTCEIVQTYTLSQFTSPGGKIWKQREEKK